MSLDIDRRKRSHIIFRRLVTGSAPTFPQGTFEGKTRWRYKDLITCKGNVADLLPTYPQTTWLWMERTLFRTPSISLAAAWPLSQHGTVSKKDCCSLVSKILWLAQNFRLAICCPRLPHQKRETTFQRVVLDKISRKIQYQFLANCNNEWMIEKLQDKPLQSVF